MRAASVARLGPREAGGRTRRPSRPGKGMKNAENSTAPNGCPQPSPLPDRRLGLALDRARGGPRGARRLRPDARADDRLVRPGAGALLDRKGSDGLAHRPVAPRPEGAGDEGVVTCAG